MQKYVNLCTHSLVKIVSLVHIVNVTLLMRALHEITNNNNILTKMASTIMLILSRLL